MRGSERNALATDRRWLTAVDAGWGGRSFSRSQDGGIVPGRLAGLEGVDGILLSQGSVADVGRHL